MPSVPERLATLESGLRSLQQRVEEIMVLIQGDGSDEGWKRSVRGRLHTIMADLATADKLAYAAQQVKEAAQAQEAAQSRRLNTWAQVVLVICGIITAAAAIIGAIAVLGG